MLLTVGGVQAVGKTTILDLLKKDAQKFANNLGYDNVNFISRSKELKELLIDAPQVFGTEEQVHNLKDILSEWVKVYDNLDLNLKTLNIVDGGLISTVNYNVMSLYDNIICNAQALQKRVSDKHPNGVTPPGAWQMENALLLSSYNQLLTALDDHLKYEYIPKVVKTMPSMFLNIGGDWKIITERFLSRDDKRSGNMQDHYENKNQELELFKRNLTRFNALMNDALMPFKNIQYLNIPSFITMPNNDSAERFVGHLSDYAPLSYQHNTIHTRIVNADTNSTQGH